jgi:anti-sigma regulatory factor (Ser/Thr protein kinase)
MSARFRHEALFYSGSAEFISGTIPFIRGGLTAGEPVLVVETAHKIDMLRVALGAEADAVHFADMERVGANPAHIIPAWRDFVTEHANGSRHLRGIGEPIWTGRSADELVESQRHESLLNVAFGPGRPWELLCPYDIEKLDDTVIAEARRSHEFITEGGSSGRSREFRGREASAAPFEAPLRDPGQEDAVITFDRDTLAQVRELVASWAAIAGIEESRAAGLGAAVNEVATNSIVHGGGSGTVRIWHEPEVLLCEVRDQGRFDRPLVDRERPSPRSRAPRGLWLANHLCDLVQIRTLPDGTAVRLHMRMERSGQLHRH